MSNLKQTIRIEIVHEEGGVTEMSCPDYESAIDYLQRRLENGGEDVIDDTF